MQTPADPRHLKRKKAVKELFAASFTKKQHFSELTKKVLTQAKTLDKLIGAAAPQWPVDKLNIIDLSILRLAVYELINTDTPHKVVIDEAIELAKRYGAESSPSFVNGVLGTVLKEIKAK